MFFWLTSLTSQNSSLEPTCRKLQYLCVLGTCQNAGRQVSHLPCLSACRAPKALTNGFGVRYRSSCFPMCRLSSVQVILFLCPGVRHLVVQVCRQVLVRCRDKVSQCSCCGVPVSHDHASRRFMTGRGRSRSRSRGRSWSWSRRRRSSTVGVRVGAENKAGTAGTGSRL